MGHSRPRPKHLAKKLLQIRRSLGVSQGELVRRLGVQDLIDHTTVSKYELDKNEPPLAILLAYARLVEIPVEQIIDDEIELTISSALSVDVEVPINRCVRSFNNSGPTL